MVGAQSQPLMSFTRSHKDTHWPPLFLPVETLLVCLKVLVALRLSGTYKTKSFVFDHRKFPVFFLLCTYCQKTGTFLSLLFTGGTVYQREKL